MQLVADWRRVLRRAWSVRAIAFAALFSALEVALPFLEGLLPVPRGVFAGLSAAATALAFVFRILAQKEFDHADQ